MKNKRVLFIIALIVPIVILLSITWKPISTLNTGESIVLETIPVDPRDVLYGDYVMLQFAVEEFSKDKLDPQLIKEFEKHNTGKIPVYAILQKEDDGIYGLQSVTHKKPSEGIFLNGDMYYYGSEEYNEVNQKYFANFLPDRFYVAENTGMQLEDLSRQGQLLADVKVKDGFAVLENVRPK